MFVKLKRNDQINRVKDIQLRSRSAGITAIYKYSLLEGGKDLKYNTFMIQLLKTVNRSMLDFRLFSLFYKEK